MGGCFFLCPGDAAEEGGGGGGDGGEGGGAREGVGVYGFDVWDVDAGTVGVWVGVVWVPFCARFCAGWVVSVMLAWSCQANKEYRAPYEGIRQEEDKVCVAAGSHADCDCAGSCSVVVGSDRYVWDDDAGTVFFCHYGEYLILLFEVIFVH